MSQKLPQRPSVAGMTVQQERAALAEIRKQGENISPHYVLEQANMKAGEFALAYIMGQHAKRQDKHQRQTRAVHPCQGDPLLAPPDHHHHHGPNTPAAGGGGDDDVRRPAAPAGPFHEMRDTNSC